VTLQWAVDSSTLLQGASFRSAGRASRGRVVRAGREADGPRSCRRLLSKSVMGQVKRPRVSHDSLTSFYSCGEPCRRVSR
jgi:hypothetical protein